MGVFVVKRVKIQNADSSEGVSIGMQNPEDSSVLWIFENIDSQGIFENKVKELKEDLDNMVKEGKRIWNKIRRESEDVLVLRAGMDPEDAWKVLEKSEEDELFQLFNNLPENDRKAIANYVFTNLNVFKDRPMYFSQHYDYASNILVRD